MLQVAQETVKERQLVADQVTALAKNQIKSGLDVSFANVNLAQAQLLLIQARTICRRLSPELSAALGYSDQRTFQLAEEPCPRSACRFRRSDSASLAETGPELIGQRLDVKSAQSYATAERDLWFPTISAVGVAGLAPYREGPLASPATPRPAFNVNIPIFNGHCTAPCEPKRLRGRRREDQYLRDLQDPIVRDVRTAWLNANSAFQRLSVTQQLLDQATQALNLAQSRYKLGLSSIVELSQAQLNQTQAQIEQASAKYDYETQNSVLNYQLGALH